MITAIASSIQPSTSAATAARPMRVVTNASPAARQRLQRLGFAVQPMDNSSTVDIDTDIVVIDRTVTALWSPLDAQKIKSPVVIVDGLASPQADYGSDMVQGHDAALVRALALAVRFAQPRGDRTEKGLGCGKLSLQNSRAFWDGVDLELTIGEYRLLELLASRPGHYFSYRELYDRLRHEGFVAGDGPRGYWVNVRSAIKRIRNSFRALEPGFAEIENYAAVGYCWRKPA